MVTTERLLRTLEEQRLLAILRGRDAAAVVAAGQTLIECGVSCLEVSLTSAQGLEAIGELADRCGDRAVVGAGTVVSADDAARARDAGAQFVVTPGLGPGVDAALALDLPVIGGAFTPTEVLAAAARCAAVKLFPASIGGPAYLAALRGPLPQVPLVPVGGIDADAVPKYLAAGAVAVGVGSPLVVDACDGGDLGPLRERARRFLAAVEDRRSA
jgi:2-dehydro-3-deoxyphosphogluconate aldolase/(4S)-4-hydroxy-2-oxoglutarate aldolase